VLIYRDQAEFKLLQDALALREVYYTDEPNLVICGSQPNLLAKFSNPIIGETANHEIHKFYNNEYRDRKWIGSATYFANIWHLLPNHLLNLKTFRVSRYWPNDRIIPIALDEAAHRSGTYLEGMLKAATQRFSVMMAVTAGTDSRTLLAASRSASDKIHYFINDHALGDSHPDIRIPRQIFKNINLTFHVQPVPTEIDPAFKEIFQNNVFQATDKLLPTIYNVYFKHHTEKLNILGVGEIGRTRYGNEPRNPTAYQMAYALGYKDSQYVINLCEKLRPDLLHTARKFGINMMTLLYWEQMLGNWGTVGNSESDIAIEEFDPYDSHYLYEIFLGVESKYTKYTDNRLFQEIIRTMWPKLLEFPINPPASFAGRISHVLQCLGIYPVLKQLRYQLNYFRYRCISRKCDAI
jgi:hypothetical protein